MQLFDLTKRLFGDIGGYDEVSKGDKKKNFFMVNRRLSIGHPMQAQVLNGLRIDPVAAVDIWRNFLARAYKKTPYWMYTKGVKKAKEEKERKINIPMAVIEDYAKKNIYDLQTVKDALFMFPKEMEKELKAFEKGNK